MNDSMKSIVAFFDEKKKQTKRDTQRALTRETIEMERFLFLSFFFRRTNERSHEREKKKKTERAMIPRDEAIRHDHDR